jgi:hypothetical protein
MPHDPEVVEETKAWFVKAQHDLRVAELSLQDKPPLTDQGSIIPNKQRRNH